MLGIEIEVPVQPPQVRALVGPSDVPLRLEERVDLLAVELREQHQSAGDPLRGEHHSSRFPTRSACRHSTDAMKRAVSPVRIIRLADSSTTSTSSSRCGSASARSREVADCECAASSSNGPTR